MEEHSQIRHFVLLKGMSRVVVGSRSVIGNFNWITSLPLSDERCFKGLPRLPELIIGRHSAVTSMHILDCTDRIRIGTYSVVAGYRSQILTHSINVCTNKQESAPVSIGDYCFVGTNSTILAGSSLPSRSVLGAGSVLIQSFDEEWSLYGGVPARKLRSIASDGKFFVRERGYVS